MPTVSLIVATVGRTAELHRLFDSLAAQTFRDFETIVVDQNTDDRLRPCLERARSLGVIVKHLKHHPANLSAARNVGIDAAQGEWIGFPDDDCWYDSMLLERLAPRFRCTDPLSGAAVQWVEEGLPPELAPNLTWERSKVFRDMPVASFQLFFHRQLFERIGNFDCRLGVGLFYGAGEETDLVLRALRAGALLTYEPSAQVHHPIKTPTPDPQARLAARYRARGAGALWAKHGLPAWVIVRGLLAPVLRPLLKGSLGADLALGIAVALGRIDGLLGWHRGKS
ncbi:MAG TPA: glycosyltransferase family A protein [Noviherbaspirillum sp.]|nr:glycosyltransferase family A protein [Noviherbaspirillum sp.]